MSVLQLCLIGLVLYELALVAFALATTRRWRQARAASLWTPPRTVATGSRAAARLRPVTAADLAPFALSGHKRCQGTGVVRVRANPSRELRVSACECAEKLLLKLRRGAYRADGQLMVPALEGEAPAQGEARAA